MEIIPEQYTCNVQTDTNMYLSRKKVYTVNSKKLSNQKQKTV